MSENDYDYRFLVTLCRLLVPSFLRTKMFQSVSCKQYWQYCICGNEFQVLKTPLFGKSHGYKLEIRIAEKREGAAYSVFSGYLVSAHIRTSSCKCGIDSSWFKVLKYSMRSSRLNYIHLQHIRVLHRILYLCYLLIPFIEIIISKFAIFVTVI